MRGLPRWDMSIPITPLVWLSWDVVNQYFITPQFIVILNDAAEKSGVEGLAVFRHSPTIHHALTINHFLM